MVIFGGIGVLIGILGILTAITKNCCCVGIYSTMSFIIALVFIIVGVILLAISSIGED